MSRFHPKILLKLLRDAGKHWVLDDVPTMSSALAFQAILSLAPLLILIVSAFSLIFGADVIEDEIVQQVRESVGENAAHAIQNIITSVGTSLRETLAIGAGMIILLIVFASGVFHQLIVSINFIWGIKAKTDHGIVNRILRLVKRRFLSFLIILGIGLWLYASIMLKAIKAIPEQFLTETFPAAETLLPHIPTLFSAVIYSVLFAVLYKILPDVKVKWRDVWCGAIVTGVLFVAVNNLIAFYFQKTIVASFYGAAGSFIIFLLWIFWSANVFLFGAELTKQCSDLDGECATADIG
jgi:membrane protein